MNVDGMGCTNCALGISRQLEKMGFTGVNADFASGEVVFTIPNGLAPEDAIKKIRSMGYVANPARPAEMTEKQPFYRSTSILFGFSLVFTIPLLLSMLLPFPLLHHPWVQFALCLPVYIAGMFHFGRSAWGSLKSGVPNMDVLITLGATAAFAYSLSGTILGLGHKYLFFETAASVFTLILFGNLLEHRAVKKTTSAIDELIRLQKTTARLIVFKNGHETTVETDAACVKPGDILLVNSGDKIAADGAILSGEASVDESMLSGESIPVFRPEGSRAIGGTIVVSGSIRVRVEATGNDSVLGQIIRLVKEARQDKPRLQSLADRISAVFVPVVVAVSMITFGITFWVAGVEFQESLLRSIAVLVIACPCALGLAIPTAVIVGVGRVARQGILIRGGSTLQKLSEIKTLVFDKTGTLTEGNFRVNEVRAVSESPEIIRSVLLEMERYSAHPLAKAVVVEFDGAQGYMLSEVTETRGLGLSATDSDGNIWEAGSYRIAESLTTDNSYQIYLLKNKALAGMIKLSDDIREDAVTGIKYFRQKGIQTVMLSGDRRERCEQVAEVTGIGSVFSEKLPAEKLELIRKMKAAGGVAMAGDGINDAPALATADVGISLGNASSVAIQSAQVILLNNRLALLTKAYAISRSTMKIIRQNLFWAFFYNIVAIPIAITGHLNPMVAAAVMALSDVIVVFNSLRLRYKRLD